MYSKTRHENKHAHHRFKCNECQKRFQHRCELKEHSNIHNPKIESSALRETVIDGIVL